MTNLKMREIYTNKKIVQLNRPDAYKLAVNHLKTKLMKSQNDELNQFESAIRVSADVDLLRYRSFFDLV